MQCMLELCLDVLRMITWRLFEDIYRIHTTTVVILKVVILKVVLLLCIDYNYLLL